MLMKVDEDVFDEIRSIQTDRLSINSNENIDMPWYNKRDVQIAHKCKSVTHDK